MPSMHSSPFHQMASPLLQSLLQTTTHTTKKKKSNGGILRMFKLLSMLKTGCKMVALLGWKRKPLLTDNATIVTIFGHRRGKLNVAIQEDPHRLPIFVIELPMHTTAFQKEMEWDVVRLALISDAKTQKKRLLEEFVWVVYCNGRKCGYCIRRKDMSDDDLHVMRLLRGVSMSAGVIPGPNEMESRADGDQLTYLRARFERVVGSKDAESLYMLNPDGSSEQELSIFFVREH